MSKNYGFSIALEKEHSSTEDWVVGAVSLPDITDIKESDREKYLPKGEVQRGNEDMMDCASRGPNNILETKFNWLVRNNKLQEENMDWLEEKGYINEEGDVEFSDAFVAIKSGTGRGGNSLKAPLQAIHEFGLIPKKLMPFKPEMTFDEYHDPRRITQEIANLGLQFKARFLINYGKVYEKDYAKLLEEDMIVVAGYAWPDPVEGVYPRVEYDPTHCWINFKRLFFAFDNYFDSVDGDFIKKLAPDYNFLDYGYRIIVREVEIKDIIDKGSNNAPLDLLMRIVAGIKEFFKTLLKKYEHSH